MPDQPIRPRTVPGQRLAALRDRLPAARFVGDPDTAVTGITHDSRQVRSGDLYLARAGERTHGIEHVQQAVAAGATAVLTDAAASERAAESGVPVVVVDDPRAVSG